MAANTIPIFPASIRHAHRRASAQATGAEDHANNVDVVTAGANGSRIDDIWNYATSTVGGVYLFINNGSNDYLVGYVASASGSIQRVTDLNFPIFLQSGWKLRMGDTSAGQVARIHARVADY